MEEKKKIGKSNTNLKIPLMKVQIEKGSNQL